MRCSGPFGPQGFVDGQHQSGTGRDDGGEKFVHLTVVQFHPVGQGGLHRIGADFGGVRGAARERSRQDLGGGGGALLGSGSVDGSVLLWREGPAARGRRGSGGSGESSERGYFSS